MKKCFEFSNCYLMGPTGPKGDADTIEIRNTKTVPSASSARVIDNYDTGKHVLDFEIPMGVIGPTGPIGPMAISIFGYKYSDIGSVINLTKQIIEIVPLNRNGEAREVELEYNNGFKILHTGIYRIDYYLSGSISSDTAFFTEILQNDRVIDGTTISKDLTTNNDSDFYGAVITNLRENDIIRLGVRANNDVVLTLAPDINSYVIVTKLV